MGIVSNLRYDFNTSKNYIYLNLRFKEEVFKRLGYKNDSQQEDDKKKKMSRKKQLKRIIINKKILKLKGRTL